MSLAIFPLPGGDALLTPELQRERAETPGTDTWRYNDLSHPRSNTSLKVRERPAFASSRMSLSLLSEWHRPSLSVPVSQIADCQHFLLVSLIPE